jgi:hypothetical protein
VTARRVFEEMEPQELVLMQHTLSRKVLGMIIKENPKD